MENTKKENMVLTRDKMIKKIAAKTGRNVETIRKFYNALEETLFETLSSANKDTDVTVKLCEGIMIDSKFIPEEDRFNNLVGKIIKTKEKIKCKATVTRTYSEKLTAGDKI